MRVPIISTPTIYLEDLGVWVKLENMQYTGSIKVRPAYFMLMQAVREGKLQEDGTFIEASSGNTAIALAHLAGILGMKFVAVLPHHASSERKKILRYLGAELVEADADAVIQTAQAIADEKGYFYVGQHVSPYNSLAHEMSTAPESLRDLPDVPDCIAMGVGTGGTITGFARFFRRLKEDIYVVGIRPREGEQLIEGISRNYLPAYDRSVVDEEIEASADDVKDFHRYLARRYGLFVGYSAAANILITSRLKKKRGCNVAFTVVPDGGDRYVSTL